MGTSPSNSVGPSDVSARISPPREHDEEGTRVRAKTVGAAQCNLSSVADRIGKEQMQAAASPRAGNSSSFEPDAWTPTPLLRRPSDPLSKRTKFLIASAVAAPLAGYFVFGSSDRPVHVAVAPGPTIEIPPVEFLPLREAQAPAATALGITVESRAEPEVQTASLQPAARLDIKPTESGIEARPPQTLPDRGKQLFAASGNDSTCFLSASAVRQNYPGGWPSWTLRAPGHEGTRCWFAATPTKAETQASSAKVKGITVESGAEPEVQAASLQPTVRLDIKSTESGIEARQPQTLPERGKQLFAASGRDSTCFPSALAVRQNYPGGWPSWTLRAPGHEGTRCWYAGTRTTANDHQSEMMPKNETVGTTEKLGSPGVLFGVQ
jgi:hypothetical protein